MLAEFLQFRDQRREVAVARNNYERIDVLLGVRQVHGIDAKADVGGVLAGLRSPRDFDELDRRFVKWARVRREAVPIGIGPFGDDLTLFDDSLEHPPDVESFPPAVERDADVFEINEYRERVGTVRQRVFLYFILANSSFASFAAFVFGYCLMIYSNFFFIF